MYLRLYVSADIFRGNASRKGRESRKRLHLQRRSSAPTPPAVCRDRQTDGGRGGEQHSLQLLLQDSQRRKSNAPVRDGKERKAMESISATSFSVKGPLLCLPLALQHVTENCKK